MHSLDALIVDEHFLWICLLVIDVEVGMRIDLACSTTTLEHVSLISSHLLRFERCLMYSQHVLVNLCFSRGWSPCAEVFSVKVCLSGVE